MTPDKLCYDFIKNKEGLSLKAYKDSAGVWTIGYGTIIYENHIPVAKGDVITLDQAENLLTWEVTAKGIAVNEALSSTSINQNQYNALVSFAYNLGIGALLSSTLLKRVVANPNDPTIQDAFMMWDKAHVDGQLIVVSGLKKRREEEAKMYSSSSV
jgi:lysozyme